MFLLSVLPAFVVLFIRSGVPESPAFEASKAHEKPHLWVTITEHKGLVLYMVLLMMCFNLFSHGTQDLYPTFLQKQHNFDPGTVSFIVIVANLGAIAGGLIFGHVSEKIGRVNAITVAALIALPALYLWAYSATPILLAVGAFIMQVAVQGAWGVIPAHLNELVAGGRARDHSRLRLSGRQFPRLLQRSAPGADRGSERRQLRVCAGSGGGRGRGRDRHCDTLQPGAARRTFEGALRACGTFPGEESNSARARLISEA